MNRGPKKRFTFHGPPARHPPAVVRQTAVEVVAIGVSTGGPNALSVVLPALPSDLPVPVLIVQHIPPVFTNLLAERLGMKSALKVREAAQGDEILAGQAYVAPGNHHMAVACDGPVRRIETNQAPARELPAALRSTCCCGRSWPRMAPVRWA